MFHSAARIESNARAGRKRPGFDRSTRFRSFRFSGPRRPRTHSTIRLVLIPECGRSREKKATFIDDGGGERTRGNRGLLAAELSLSAVDQGRAEAEWKTKVNQVALVN